jgi:site-specific recombinase XerD
MRASAEHAEAPGPVADSAFTIDDFDRRYADFAAYAEHSLGHSAATLRGYRDAYRNFRRYLLEGTRPLAEKFFDIPDWVGWNARRGLGRITTNTYWRQLRSFFADLEKRDSVYNPFHSLRPPKLPDQQPKAFRPEDCSRILATAENIPWPNAFERRRAVAVLGTIIYAGLRRGELLHLAFTDVDLATRTIRIRAGKGTGGGKDRTAYFGRELHAIFTLYLLERRKLRIEGPGFFASSRSGQAISMSVLRRLHGRVRRASGIPFSLHSLRHSFVTMMLSAGVPVHVAQALAGHTKLTTTAAYLRVFDED